MGGTVFQSPSLRGSGRFARRCTPGADGRRRFQSPSLRGSGRFQRVDEKTLVGALVSIPFIAGQWSLRGVRRADRPAAVSFQSPSLRGSGRFTREMTIGRNAVRRFNPLHCGAVVASEVGAGLGYWSWLCFNPLHCGAVVASDEEIRGQLQKKLVSIPFIAGQWSLPA